MDIDDEAGKRIALGIEKSYGEKKVHFIYADVSNRKQMSGKLQNEIPKSRTDFQFIRCVIFCTYKLY